MCHKPISELSPTYREKAREIESLLSHQVAIVTQAEICRETGANKDKIHRMIANDLDLIASTLVVLGLKVVPDEFLYCSPEIAEATRQMLANCFTSPDYVRIMFNHGVKP